MACRTIADHCARLPERLFSFATPAAISPQSSAEKRRLRQEPPLSGEKSASQSSNRARCFARQMRPIGRVLAKVDEAAVGELPDPAIARSAAPGGGGLWEHGTGSPGQAAPPPAGRSGPPVPPSSQACCAAVERTHRQSPSVREWGASPQGAYPSAAWAGTPPPPRELCRARRTGPVAHRHSRVQRTSFGARWRPHQTLAKPAEIRGGDAGPQSPSCRARLQQNRLPRLRGGRSHCCPQRAALRARVRRLRAQRLPDWRLYP